MKESVEGEPGVDYPILSAAPETSFECTDRSARNFIQNIWYLSFLYLAFVMTLIFFSRPDGMYADTEAECQVGGEEYNKRDILRRR